MARPLFSNRRFQITTVLLLITTVIFLGWNLGGYSLINVTEARQAEIARQMWLTHDWITPRYNGDPYFDKPALLHWLIAFGFSIFGPHEWVVRLPSLLGAIATLLATWIFLNTVATRRLALITTGILAANPFSWALARIGFHDMLMACFMTLTLYLWFWADHQPQRKAYVFSCACLALATLAKGPLALLLCLFIVPIYTLWSGRRPRSVPWGWGLLVFIVLAGPWYLLVIQANGWDYIRYFFGDSNVSRFLSVNQNQWGPPYYYLLSLGIFFFPWILAVPTAIWRTLRQRWLKDGIMLRALDQFMVVWVLAVLIFMSLAATKLSWYVYPALPAFSYLSARVWESQLLPPHRGFKWTAGLMVLVYGGVMIALATGHLGDPALLQSLEMAHLRWLWLGLFAIATSLIAFCFYRQQVGLTVVVGVITFGCIGLTGAHALMPVLDVRVLDRQLIPIAQTLQEVTCESCDAGRIAVLGLRLPSLNFYSGLTKIERLDEICQIPAQLHPRQKLFLISTSETLEAEKLTFETHQMRQKSGEFRLLELLPSEQNNLRLIIEERCSQT